MGQAMDASQGNAALMKITAANVFGAVSSNNYMHPAFTVRLLLYVNFSLNWHNNIFADFKILKEYNWRQCISNANRDQHYSLQFVEHLKKNWSRRTNWYFSLQYSKRLTRSYQLKPIYSMLIYSNAFPKCKYIYLRR